MLYLLLVTILAIPGAFTLAIAIAFPPKNWRFFTPTNECPVSWATEQEIIRIRRALRRANLPFDRNKLARVIGQLSEDLRAAGV